MEVAGDERIVTELDISRSDRARLATQTEVLDAQAVELRRSNAELEQFAYVASHDLQEPLRKVRTFTERVTATESEALSERGRDYLQRAGASAERMQRLIEDLLTFSRVTTHSRPFVPVDLEQVARDVVEDLDGYWKYLTHPAHVDSEMKGIPLLARFVAFDVTDSNDPEIGDKLAGLQRRNFAEHPEVAALVAQAASFRVPDGKGQS